MLTVQLQINHAILATWCVTDGLDYTLRGMRMPISVSVE